MTTLEERVARLEAGQERIERDMQEARHGLRAGLDAHSMAIGLGLRGHAGHQGGAG